MGTTEKKEELKILVTGDVEGKFLEVFTRVKKVHEKNGPFHMLFCVGDFFPNEDILDLKIPPSPIPTFILGPTNVKQLPFFSNIIGGEISDNITFLGQSGVYTGSSGLKVAYLSGVEANPLRNREIEFNHEDIRKIQLLFDRESSSKGVDLLLTSQWPSDVEKFAPAKPETSPNLTSPLVSQLAAILKPRYHFCAKDGIHYERVPYRNHRVLAEPTQNITRFISLAKVGNTTKKKWLYAFNIVPAKHIDSSDPSRTSSEATEFPYRDVMEYNPESKPSNSMPQQFFYKIDDGESSQQQHRNGGKRQIHNNPNRGGYTKKPYHQERRPPIQIGSCWFCLASPEVEKHLVISVGDSVYLTLAKGGLTSDHVLILPIGHIESTVECSPDILEEIGKFKSSLKKYFTSINKGVVFYERNFRSPHLQIQVVPVPLSIVPKLKSLCLDYGTAKNIQMEDIPSNAEISQLSRPGFPYFYIEFPDESKLFIQIHKGFPLQFGRELLASEFVLNIPDRVDWQNCKVDKDEEGKLTSDFRTAYKNFDFTL